MEQNFKFVKTKAEESGLHAEQIKAALKLFQYADLYKVEFYLKDGDRLGMRAKTKKPDAHLNTGDIIDQIFGR